MQKPVYFLADLHLPASPSPLRTTFLEFLRGPALKARALYILGDLFEFWVGDDYGLDVYYEETMALRAVHHAGVAVYFQHGNRDFLVGRQFADLSEARILPEQHMLHLGAERVVLAHGDQYCTDDRAYQRWRLFCRNPEAQLLFSWLPRWLRERIGASVRARSTQSVRNKTVYIMDVNENAVRNVFKRTGADRIIHGHTHRPADHVYDDLGRRRNRTVLADWRQDRREVLSFDGVDYRRVPLSTASSA